LLAASKAQLEKLTAPALRMQLIGEFASLARVSSEDVERLLQPRRTPAYRNPGRAKEAAPIASSQERNLLRCVLARPDLAADLEDDLLDPSLPETSALRAIAGLDEASSVSGALLVDRFEGTEFEQIVFQAQAAGLEQELSADAAEHDFRQINLALRIRRKNGEIEVLKGRVGADPRLNPELNQRVKELARLKMQRI